MSTADSSADPFDSGDRVRAAENLGGFLRPKVPLGTPGVIIRRRLDHRLTVRFINDQTVTARPEQLSPLERPR